ncbi:MAG TPA: SLC13 family permease [Alphaproteobacteria bacterium]|nr:SLC13 family permease [Alphaproteobacteria bacterium]
MTELILALFVVTYLGMALGRFPGLKVDRAGIAMIAAVVLVAAGAVPRTALGAAIHFPTLLLLGSLMILSARLGAAGFYDGAAAWIARQAGRPTRLLALTVAVGGLLSALLVNDVVVFAMTPLLCRGLSARKLDARPFLLGLAAASNAGSAAMLIGNPQNILIGQAGGLGFWSYAAAALVPALAALAISFALIAFLWRRELAIAPAPATLPDPALDRPQAILSALAVAILLALFATPLPREISGLLVAAFVIVSRKLPSRKLLDEIDLPLLILFASLFVVNDALARTAIAERGVAWLAGHGLLPTRVALLAPLALVLSNTIGNVPAVVMILKLWHGIPAGTLVGLAVLSTLAGNLLLVGSIANLIVAERAASVGTALSFRDHARAGVPIALLSMLAASLWLWGAGYMAL